MTSEADPTALLVGQSASITSLRTLIRRVGPTPVPVLVLGETGTGKELVARSLHEASSRRGPFVTVDCASLSTTLVESELFGHERGAFTGATRSRPGLVHSAQGGTLFLDEIAELPVESQTRLLRLLQEQTYRRVGSDRERKADVRVVAATWQDLEQRVIAGTFRKDLYHRLRIVEIRLDPLRRRREDIPVLLDHFLASAAPTPLQLDGLVQHHLKSWPWPGNVRELRNVAVYIGAMCTEDVVRMQHLPQQLLRPPPDVEDDETPQLIVRVDLPYMDARRVLLDAFQRLYVAAQLEASGGNISLAARTTGMDRRSLQRMLARFREEDAKRKRLDGQEKTKTPSNGKGATCACSNPAPRP